MSIRTDEIPAANGSMSEEPVQHNAFMRFVHATGMLGNFDHLNLKDPFLIKQYGSNWWTEIRAGTVTFLTMAYILPINASTLSVAIPDAKSDLVIATASSACIGCVLMGILSNFPFGLAPGMGSNAYFAYVAVLAYGLPWQVALTAVFFSATMFLILSILGLRTLLVKLLPRGVQLAMGAGIGMFLCFIGLQNAQGTGIITDSPATLTTLNIPLTVESNYDAAKMWLSVAVLILTTCIMAMKIPGAPLVGIIFGTIVAWADCWAQKDNSAFNYPFGECQPGLNATEFADAGCRCYAPNAVVATAKITKTAGVFDWTQVNDPNFWVAVFTFLYTDILDSSGTFYAVIKRAGRLDANGNMPHGNANMAYVADSIASMIGAALGTSTVTTLVESSAGVVDGGKTGVVALTVGAYFALSIPFAPLISQIPPLASGPILTMVGGMMMKNMEGLDWSDVEEALPAFACMVMVPFTYSIAYGIISGVMFWIVLQVLMMPYRMIKKQDPFVKFKELLTNDPIEELGNSNPAMSFQSADASVNKLAEEIQMTSPHGGLDVYEEKDEEEKKE